MTRGMRIPQRWYGIFPDQKLQGYGKLSHKNLDDLQGGNRSLLVSGEDQKEDPLDFVLWKPKKRRRAYWDSCWCQAVPAGTSSAPL